MAAKEGFTLIEIIVVMIIVGVVAAISIPSFVTSMEQTKAQTAKYNLLAISAAQSKFNEDYSPANSNAPTYCINTSTNFANTLGAPGSCGDNLQDLNTYLHLNMQANDPFSYSCSTAAESIPYNCQASDGKVTLTLDPNAQPTISCAPAGNLSCPS